MISSEAQGLGAGKQIPLPFVSILSILRRLFGTFYVTNALRRALGLAQSQTRVQKPGHLSRIY